MIFICIKSCILCPVVWHKLNETQNFGLFIETFEVSDLSLENLIELLYWWILRSACCRWACAAWRIPCTGTLVPFTCRLARILFVCCCSVCFLFWEQTQICMDNHVELLLWMWLACLGPISRQKAMQHAFGRKHSIGKLRSVGSCQVLFNFLMLLSPITSEPMWWHDVCDRLWASQSSRHCTLIRNKLRIGAGSFKLLLSQRS